MINKELYSATMQTTRGTIGNFQKLLLLLQHANPDAQASARYEPTTPVPNSFHGDIEPDNVVNFAAWRKCAQPT